MTRNITVTFDDGTSHVYQNAPDDLTPDMVQQRAQKDFGKTVTALDGGKSSGGIPVGRTTSTQEGTMGAYVSRQPVVEPTTTQKIYQAVRPFAAPLVEGAGMIGGGILGGTAGTFGAGPVGTAVGGVAGAGLGYGMGKELMQLADVNLGSQPNRVSTAQVTEPIKNIIEGATMEAGGRALIPALGYAAGKVADLRQIPAQKAAVIARNALGPDLPLVLNALKGAQGEAVTAGQAAADINSPVFQSLMDRAIKRDPRFLEALKTSQGDVSVNALANLAGGTTATETRAAGEAAKSNLNAITSPMRETALNRANLGKAVSDYEAQAGTLSDEAAAKVADVRRLVNAGNLAEASARLDLIKQGRPVGAVQYTYKGELAKKADDWASQAANASLDLGQGARFAQGAADSLRSAGIKPLEGATLAQNISGIANKPEFAGNDLLSGAAKNVAEDIAKWTDSGGVVDARALDAIRKNSVNAAIQQLRPGADATTQRNLAAGVLSKIKPLIDDAIESAGGEGYKQYLADYSKGMQKIAEQKLTGKALELWQSGPAGKDAFVNLVQGKSPAEVEKILGPGSYDIAKEVSGNTLSVLQDQAVKAIRDVKVTGQAAAGQDALRELLSDQISKLRIPSYLSKIATTTNAALNILEGKIGKSTMDALTQASKTPGGAVKLLETLPANDRNRVIQLLSNPQQWKPGIAGAVTNALAPESNNQNALAK
jgi:hypothetical protein